MLLTPSTSDRSNLDLDDRTRALIDSHEIISFDVFDTLIVRRLPKPTDVFSLVRLRLLTQADPNDAQIVDGFPASRVRAERIARDGTGEVTLDEIYAAYARESGAPGRLIDDLKAMELAIEREVVYANPVAKRLLDYSRSAGKTIVFCSDMYLPSDEIARLLRICAYDVAEPIYVSCEFKASKHLGTLYPVILARHGVSAPQALHIGDNIHGDVTMARAAGLSALHLPLVPATIGTLLDVNDEEGHRVVHAVVEGIIDKRARESTLPNDRFEELGFRVFGPLLAGFSIWLARKVEERRPDKLIFLARDGFFIRRYLARFSEQSTDEAYLYGSRGSLLLPSFTDFPIARLVHLVSGKKRLSVARHLRRLGLHAGRFPSVIRSVGFTGPDDLVSNGDPRMIALLAKLHRELLQIALQRRPLAQRYVTQCVSLAKRVFVIDVGWIGTTQASLARLLQRERGDVVLEGHYVAVLARPDENASTKHTMTGWLSAGATAWERSVWWSGGVELLEFAMTAPHGTTIGYEERSDGQVVQILDAAPNEDNWDRVERLQRGAAAFIDDLRSAYGNLLDTVDSRAWAERFFTIVTEPTREETELLGDVRHGDVAGDASISLALAPRVDDSKSLVDALEQSFWKAGFIVRNGLRERFEFDADLYLATYPDVRAAMKAGEIDSARAHFDSHGMREGRIGSWADAVRESREPDGESK